MTNDFWKTLKQRLKKITVMKKTHAAIQSLKSLAKTKQRVLLGVIFGGVFVLIILLVNVSQPPKPVIHKKQAVIPVKIDSGSDALRHWTVTSGAAIANLQEQFQSQQQALDARSRALNDLQKKFAAQQQTLSTLKNDLQDRIKESAQERDALRDDIAKALADQKADFIKAEKLKKASSLAQEDNLKRREPLPLNQFAPQFKGEAKPTLEAATDAEDSENFTDNPYEGWLPVGAFFKATLLNGIAAPTGTAGSTDPVPILMKVMSDAILPNDRWQYQLRGCFVMGTAYGSVSSERVAIRLARVSCLSANGNALIAAPLKGFVVDSDGKADLRGELVNRQGTKVAMAALAGMTQGVGQMLGNAQGTSLLTASGNAVSANTAEKLRAAGFGGAAQAANTVADFYVKQAEAIYPVIVINAGRNVTIDMTQGTQLRWQDRAHHRIPHQAINEEKNS